MAWVRLDDQIPRNEKILKAGPAACWLWVCGIAHCQSQLTDGFISDDVLPMIGIVGTPRARRLADSLVAAGLFDRVEGGYKVHDYLQHNPCRAEVLEKRAQDVDRKMLAKRVRESERNPSGIHLESSALARGRALDGMGKKNAFSEKDESPIERRARWLLESYPRWYAEKRHGARLKLLTGPLVFTQALEIVRTWEDDKRLEKMAVIVLTSDEDWLSRTDRGFNIFATKATWADDRLKQWEREHGVSV